MAVGVVWLSFIEGEKLLWEVEAAVVVVVRETRIETLKPMVSDTGPQSGPSPRRLAVSSPAGPGER